MDSPAAAPLPAPEAGQPDISVPMGPIDLSDLTIERLGQMCTAGYERFRQPRMQRHAAYELYTGRHYFSHKNLSIDGKNAERASPLNLGAQQVRTLLPYIGYTAGNPEIDPRFGDLELEAQIVEAEMEFEAERLRLVEKYQSVAIDAILGGKSFMKVGIKDSKSVLNEGGREIDNGEAFEEPVDFDDYFPDPDARTENEVRIEGHRQRAERIDLLSTPLGYDPARDGPMLHPAVASPEEAADMVRSAPDIGPRGRDLTKVSALSLGPRAPITSTGVIEIWEVYVYRGGTTICLQFIAEQPGQERVRAFKNKLIRAWEYKGPERSPLEGLSFLAVPSNIMPLSLESLQRDLALVADAIAMKAIRQLLRAKTVPVVKQSHTDLAVAMAKAGDGVFLTGDPSAIGKVDFLAQLDQFIPGMAFIKEQWNTTTGNLELASGTNDIGQTATAFAGLMGRVTGWISFLQNRMETFATRCLKRRASIFINDQFVDRMVPFKTPFGAIGVPYNASSKSGTYPDFNYKIRAYSMQASDPSIQMQRIVELFGQVIPAVMSVAQTGLIDPQKALRIIAAKFDLPELEQMLLDPQAQMQMMAMQALGPAPNAPPPSSRLAMGKITSGSTQPVGAARSAMAPSVPPGPVAA